MAKNKQINLCVSDWEYELIKENARVSGMNIPQFVRAVSKNISVEHKDKLRFVNRNDTSKP